LIISDTAGSNDFTSLRPLSYPNAEVFIVCYSVDNLASLVNAKKKWAEEVRHYAQDIPMLLVGLKRDLRNDKVLLDKESIPKKLIGTPPSNELNLVEFVEAESAARQ
jgi:small GTP-binding protein